MNEVERIDRLEAQVYALEERIRMLVVAVQYNPKEPYLQEMSQLSVVGERSLRLQFLLSAILKRSLRKPTGAVPRKLGEVPAVLKKAYVDEAITWHAAVDLVSLGTAGMQWCSRGEGVRRTYATWFRGSRTRRFARVQINNLDG